MSNRFRYLALFSAAAAMTLTAIPAQAQFRDLFNDSRRGADKAESCEDGKSGDVGRGILGGLLGGAANRAARSAGIPLFVPVEEFTDTLSTEIACKLNPEEQAQAANATLEATRGTGEDDRPEIGASASWNSTSREDVSGTSTVTARQDTGAELDCITVTDVIIVEGEETRANKRMCRPPGSARYSIVA